MTGSGDDGTDMGDEPSVGESDSDGSGPERFPTDRHSADQPEERTSAGQDPSTGTQPDGTGTGPGASGTGPEASGTRSHAPESEPGVRQQDVEERREYWEEPQQEENEDSWGLFARDVLTSIVAVLLVGMYLFAISGVWPPMVAIESESMDPNMQVNDLVFVMEPDRFQPADAHGDTGVVTVQTGEETGYEQYGNSGDVIIFEPDGDEGDTPIIHRAMFWVEEGENWVGKANDEYIRGPNDCSQVQACPAPNAGFITKGDNNHEYDQASPTQANRPVKTEWVIGTAEVRIPRLGWFRLRINN